MHCGRDAAECVVQHWCEIAELHLRCTRAGQQWDGSCPVHGKPGLSLTVKGKGLLWKCHCGDPCPQDVLTAALRELLPDCITGRKPSRPRPVASSDDLTALALSGIPATALKVALLEMAGMGRNAAMDKLGIDRTSRYRIRDQLSQFCDKPAGQ